MYTAADITILKGLEPVRRRPAMYVGDVRHRGMHQLAEEVLANAAELALQGLASEIRVTLHADGSLQVADDGPGIRIGRDPGGGKSALETMLTTLCAGGRWDRPWWRIAGALQGIGLAVVNALSVQLQITSRRGGRVFRQRYERGEALGDVEEIRRSDRTGTTVQFTPDPEIFEVDVFDTDSLRRRLQELAYLVPGLSIVLRDQRRRSEERFHAPRGLADLVRSLAEESRIEVPVTRQEDLHHREAGQLRIQVALTWQRAEQDQRIGFANAYHCEDGGTHVKGLLKGTRLPWAWLQGRFGTGAPDVDAHTRGLVAAVSVFCSEPCFEGSRRSRIGNRELVDAVAGVTERALFEWGTDDPWAAEALFRS